MPNLDQAIREQAYHLWLADGQRDGQADAYWLAAQRYVLLASIADSTIVHDSMTRDVVLAAETNAYPAKKAKAAATSKKAAATSKKLASAPKKSKRRAA